MASVTALKGLRDIAKVGSGDRVLVVGATGAIRYLPIPLR